ncbi:MAG: hypothetical protein AB1497_01510 [Bacillota bacterium]
MRKIRDPILLGITAGVIGSLPGRLLNAMAYRCGLTDVRYGQRVAVISDGETQIVREVKTLGTLGDTMLTGLTGVAITYTLTTTGRDAAALKGAGVGAVAWLGAYGAATRLGRRRINTRRLAGPLSLFDHLISGAATALLASKLGDDEMFPDGYIAIGPYEQQDFHEPDFEEARSDFVERNAIPFPIKIKSNRKTIKSMLGQALVRLIASTLNVEVDLR